MRIKDAKPCPFCGEKVIFLITDGVCSSTLYCMCDSCGATSGLAHDTVGNEFGYQRARQDAIDLWNTRANEENRGG